MTFVKSTTFNGKKILIRMVVLSFTLFIFLSPFWSNSDTNTVKLAEKILASSNSDSKSTASSNPVTISKSVADLNSAIKTTVPISKETNPNSVVNFHPLNDSKAANNSTTVAITKVTDSIANNCSVDRFLEIWSDIFNASEGQNYIKPEILMQVMKFSIQETDQYDPTLVEFVRSLIHQPFPRESINLTEPSFTHKSRANQSKIIDSMLNATENGFFIESGAFDGEFDSNSIFFERFRNWTGILIEPAPVTFQQLLAKKRHAYAINACIADKTMVAKFKYNGVYTGREKFITQIVKEYSASHNMTWEVVYVPCFSLNTILKAMGVTRVDYFSLDVEGAEWPIIENLDFKTFDYRAFSIEYFISPPEEFQLVTNHMNKHGFNVTFKNDADVFYQKIR